MQHLVHHNVKTSPQRAVENDLDFEIIYPIMSIPSVFCISVMKHCYATSIISTVQSRMENYVLTFRLEEVLFYLFEAMQSVEFKITILDVPSLSNPYFKNMEQICVGYVTGCHFQIVLAAFLFIGFV